MFPDFAEQRGNPDQVDEADVARDESRKFLEKHGWLKRTYDLDDLVQECLERWHLARHTYQKDRGASWETYMRKVMKNRLLTILDEQSAQKRVVNHLATSLDKVISDEELTVKEVISAKGLSEGELAFLLDLERALDKLNNSQKHLCLLRHQGYNMAEITSIMHKGRATLYDDLEHIRKVFADEGLENYMT